MGCSHRSALGSAHSHGGGHACLLGHDAGDPRGDPKTEEEGPAGCRDVSRGVLMFDRLGRLVVRLRFVFVVAWVAAAVIMGALAPSLWQAGSADETGFRRATPSRWQLATSLP